AGGQQGCQNYGCISEDLSAHLSFPLFATFVASFFSSGVSSRRSAALRNVRPNVTARQRTARNFPCPEPWLRVLEGPQCLSTVNKQTLAGNETGMFTDEESKIRA